MKPSARTRSCLTGHTLIELVMSVAILSIVMVAMGGAIMLASRAVPGRDNPAILTARSVRTQDQLASELAYAKTVTEMSLTAIAFTVSDRDGDGIDETIRYSWSGKAGAPLQREYNGTKSNLIDDLHVFQLNYNRRIELLPTTYTEGSELALFSYDSSTNLDTHSVTPSNWIGQYFKPALPDGATSWRITRVLLKVRQSGDAEGETRVQIRNADAADLPGNIVYDQVSMAERTLALSYHWKELHFTQAGGIPPGQGVCITTQWVSDDFACDIQFRSGTGGIGGMVRTWSSGASWSSSSFGHCLLMQIYGRVAKRNPDSYRYLLEEVRITMRTGGEIAARTSASVTLRNLPEVSAP